MLENFRRKRSHAADVVEMVARIIECGSVKDAEEIIRLLKASTAGKAAKGKEE